MIQLNLSIVGAYLFFVAILLQGPMALIFVSTGLDLPVSPFYAAKFLLLIALLWLIFVTRTLPKLGRTEITAISVVMVITVLAFAKGAGLYYAADELKFYIVPFIVFFAGRAFVPFQSERQLAYFLMGIAALYVVLGASYEVIGREAFTDAGLKTLLAQKLGDVGRGSNEFVHGYPTNFWLFFRNGFMLPRAFGPLFDPLATAFFGVPLCLYLWEVHRRKAIAGAGFMAIAVMVILSLTLTRSIISGIVVVFLASRIWKRGIVAVPLWPALVLIIAFGAALAMNVHAAISLVESTLDPSSIAHFEAYLKWDVGSSLFGHRFANDAPRGQESLYLTIFFECGLAGLICFLIWFGHLYLRLRGLVGRPYARPAYESFVVYLFASLTTEHWFASTSGSLFWFLLGNTFGVIEEDEARNRPAIRVAAEGGSHAVGDERSPA
jgi:hypothetical protein